MDFQVIISHRIIGISKPKIILSSDENTLSLAVIIHDTRIILNIFQRCGKVEITSTQVIGQVEFLVNRNQFFVNNNGRILLIQHIVGIGNEAER